MYPGHEREGVSDSRAGSAVFVTVLLVLASSGTGVLAGPPPASHASGVPGSAVEMSQSRLLQAADDADANVTPRHRNPREYDADGNLEALEGRLLTDWSTISRGVRSASKMRTTSARRDPSTSRTPTPSTDTRRSPRRRPAKTTRRSSNSQARARDGSSRRFGGTTRQKPSTSGRGRPATRGARGPSPATSRRSRRRSTSRAASYVRPTTISRRQPTRTSRAPTRRSRR